MRLSFALTLTKHSFLTLALLACTSCVMGIPSADGFHPKAPKPHVCKVVVSDGQHAACLDEVEFARWRKRNGL
jgi:hypothetical protein